MLTFPDQRPHLHQPPGPYQEPHLNGVVVPTANHMAFLQDIKGLCCDPPRKMPYSAHSTFQSTDTSDVTVSAGSSAQQRRPHQVCHIGGGCTTESNSPVGAELQNSREFIIVCSSASGKGLLGTQRSKLTAKHWRIFPSQAAAAAPSRVSQLPPLRYQSPAPHPPRRWLNPAVF